MIETYTDDAPPNVQIALELAISQLDDTVLAMGELGVDRASALVMALQAACARIGRFDPANIGALLDAVKVNMVAGLEGDPASPGLEEIGALIPKLAAGIERAGGFIVRDSAPDSEFVQRMAIAKSQLGLSQQYIVIMAHGDAVRIIDAIDIRDREEWHEALRLAGEQIDGRAAEAGGVPTRDGEGFN